MRGSRVLFHMSVATATFIVSSCLSKHGPGSARLLDLALPADFDLTAECGISRGDASNPEFGIFGDDYHSAPIKWTGTSAGIDFRVVTSADVSIHATMAQTTQRGVVHVDEAVATSTGFLARLASSTITRKADQAATSASGSWVAKSISLAEWVNLNANNPNAFNGVICGGIGTSELNVVNGQTNAAITFSPAVIIILNPKASLQRLKAEFSVERTFAVTANATGPSDAVVSGVQSGTQTIRPIDPTIDVNGTRIVADAAWEFIFSFPKGAHTVGLPRRLAYYIDSNKKTFSLIVSESDKVDDTTGEPLPPAYLMRAGG